MAKKPKVVGALTIFDHAYRILKAENQMRQRRPGQDLEALAKGSMILSAFGLELLLKCLIVIDDKIPPQTHSLSVLFRQLNHKHKRLIVAKWDTDPDGRASITPLANQHKLPTDLPNAVVTCQKAFERMRYIYEYEDGVVYYLQGLPTLIIDVILDEIKPEWKAKASLPIS
jgi:HEPN domain-containing protein